MSQMFREFAECRKIVLSLKMSVNRSQKTSLPNATLHCDGYVVGDVQSNRFDIELGGLCQGVPLSAGKQDEPATQMCRVVNRSQ